MLKTITTLLCTLLFAISAHSALAAFTIDLHPGMDHPQAKELQQLLNQNGFTVALSGDGSRGLETTIMGPATVAALKRFQAANNITQTGIVGPLTRIALNKKLSTPTVAPTTPSTVTPVTLPCTVTIDLHPGMDHPQAKTLQQLLNQNGFTIAKSGDGAKGQETTIMGPATVAALKRFQAANNITQTGIVGPLTRIALLKAQLQTLTTTTSSTPSKTSTPTVSTPKATSTKVVATKATTTTPVKKKRSGGGGSSSGSTPSAPVATFAMTPTTVVSGSSVILTWSSTNATACTGINFSTGSATAGSVTVNPTTNTAYTLTCTGSGGSDVETRTVTVTTNPSPVVTFSVSPTNVTSGSSVSITWSSTNATACTGINFSTGSATAGSVTVNPTTSTTYTVSCTGASGSDAEFVTVTVGTAVPNQMVVSLPSGNETNYPLQFGRVFRIGEIMQSPRVLLNGTPLTTQADIKTRHTDGSVKFAVISVVLPSIGTTEKTITFDNQSAPTNTPVSIASMLADYDFEATIDVQSGGSSVVGAPVSARVMLAALSDAALASETSVGGSGPRYWTQGPVNTTVLLHDHATKAYDIGTNATKAIRPMFIVQFWPSIGKYYVRHILEVGDVTKLKDETAIDVAFTTGNASPVTELTKTGLGLYAGTFQSRAYWGGTDVPRANIKHGIAYLASTGVIPNYNPSITMHAPAIESYRTNWLTQNKNLGDTAYWQKAMASTGGRPDLGVMPKWDIVALYDGSAHMHDIVQGMSELAGSWGFFFREGTSTKNIFGATSGLGRIVSKMSRPTQMLNDGNNYMNSGSTVALADRFTLDGTISTSRNGWVHDSAHTPGMFWVSYLTTGDVFWHEKLQQLAAWSQFIVNPGLSYNSIGNGGSSSHLILNGLQSRAFGWQYRNRARAWWVAIDGSPEKDLFYKSLEDAVAQRAGLYDIAGVMVGNPIRDAWSTNYSSWYGTNTPTPRPNDLKYWEGKGGYSETQFIGAMGSIPDDWGAGAQAPWMRNFITLSLYHAVELGVEVARPLANWAVYQTILVANGPEPRHIADYVVPDLKNTGGYYQTLEDIYDGWPNNADLDSNAPSLPLSSASGLPGGGAPNTYGVTLEGYGAIAAAAIAIANGASGQTSAWTFLEPYHNNSYYFNHDPRYAIIPR